MKEGRRVSENPLSHVMTNAKKECSAAERSVSVDQLSGHRLSGGRRVRLPLSRSLSQPSISLPPFLVKGHEDGDRMTAG